MNTVDHPPIKRLIIAPHCDDETLGCGGILAKYPQETGVVVVAQPDDVRLGEFQRAHAILDYAFYTFLDFKDGYLSEDPHALVGALDTIVSRYQPQILYVPYPSTHQDHIAVYEAGVRAGRLSMTPGHWYPASLYVYDVAAYDLTLYPQRLDFNVFESLTEEQVNRKVRALEAYASQAVTGPHPANAIKPLAQACGNARRVDWAEPFAMIREVRS